MENNQGKQEEQSKIEAEKTVALKAENETLKEVIKVLTDRKKGF